MAQHPIYFVLIFTAGTASACFEIAASRGWTREFLFPVSEWLALAGSIFGLLSYALIFTYIDQL